MLRSRWLMLVLGAVCTVAVVPPTQAAMAVIDVRAITQMVQQLRTLQDQLNTARNHLTQAQQAFQSMTGGRGMERLLSGTVRNYLPPDWADLESALRGASAAHQVLTAQLQAAITANAVLTPEQLATFSPPVRDQVEAARRSAAMRQVTARQALATTSSRFQSIQQLIDAIPRATDQKAILDLQARIQAEQGMLTNEQTKLQILFQAAQAEERAAETRANEQAIVDIGSFRRLPPLNLR